MNMHADNLAEDIWAKYTGPKHVSKQKRYDGLKGILALHLTPQTPRYSQCAKPASFAAVIYHVYANFHMLSGMSGICILFVFHMHINWHLHWLFIDITEIQCWWVVFYMSKTLYCIFWDLLGILKTDKYCNWFSDYFGRTTVAIKYNIPDSNQFYTVVMLCDMSWKYWILFVFVLYL